MLTGKDCGSDSDLLTTKGVNRGLSVDVEGYSRLMSQDEVDATGTLTTCREATAALIQQYQGKVVDSPELFRY